MPDDNIVTSLLLMLLRIYQRTLSPLLGPVCRFYPSCSQYSYACIKTHGPFRGVLLSMLRLCKCHPFHPGGYDPPPLPLPFEGTPRPPLF